MNIEDLLDQIEATLDNGQQVAFSKKIVVNIDEIRSCIQDIRMNLPEEIRQARNIVADRKKILKEAADSADNTVGQAQERAHDVTTKANAKAKELVITAEERAKAKVYEADERANQIVANAEARAQAMVEESEIARRTKQYGEEVIAAAKAQAEGLTAQAQQQAEEIVSEAYANSADIKAKANKWATEMCEGASRFVNEVVNGTEDALATSLAKVRQTKENIRAAAPEKVTAVNNNSKMRNILTLFLVVVLASLALTAVGVTLSGRELPNPDVSQNGDDFTITQPDKITSATLLAVGDNLIHTAIYKQAQQRTSDGSYDFLPVYEKIRDKIAGADIAVINQETQMAASRDVSSYPTFNSPTELAGQLAAIGFDVATIANNHMLDKGSGGLTETLDLLDSTQGITPVGAYRSIEEQAQIRTVTKNEITFAFVAYTQSTNGIPIPEGKEHMIILTDNREQVKKQIALAQELADVVVVSVHFGDEYSDTENEYQRLFAQDAADSGADVIIGTHPHTLEPIKYVVSSDGRNVPVFYSLGNFVSTQDRPKRLIGGLATFAVQKNHTTGEITMSLPKLEITVTHYGSGNSGVKIYPLESYTQELANAHGIRSKGHEFSLEYIKTHARSVIDAQFLVLPE